MKEVFFKNKEFMRIFLIILGSVFTTLVIVFSALSIRAITSENLSKASIYLLCVFIVLACSRLVTFFKDRSKINLIRFLVLLAFDIAIGVIILFGQVNESLYSICGGLYCLSIIVSRVFKMLMKRTARAYVLNGILILFAFLVGIGLMFPGEILPVQVVILIVCTFVTITAFLEVVSAASSSLKFNVLFKIIMRTYALEILIGLLTVMVAFSLLFPLFEEKITNFGDGLWYSFTVITTIGFGDMVATSLVGRILTVILGMYGIIIVAVITSIIVNFYNETAGKKDESTLKEIKNEQENENKKVPKK